MWPLSLHISKDECRGILRRLGKKNNKNMLHINLYLFFDYNIKVKNIIIL